MIQKLFNIIIVSLLLNISFSQTNFDRGYSAGYKSGFCKDKIGCVTPIPPIAPIPNINESYNSYQNGYDRGFIDGLNKQKQSSSDDQVGPKPARYEYKPIQFDPRVQYMRNEIIRMGTELAFQNYNNGNYDMAIDHAQKVMNSTGVKTRDLCFVMGMAYARIYYYKSARKWLKKAGWKQHPTAWEEWLKVKADYKKNKGKWIKA